MECLQLYVGRCERAECQRSLTMLLERREDERRGDERRVGESLGV